MKKLLLTFVLVFGFISHAVMAVEKDDFNLETTQDLLNLCMVQTGQPFSIEAIHFCEGMISGAVRYHDHIVSKNMKRIICYPKGATRNDAIIAISEWGKANQANTQLMNDPAMFGLIRALQSKWPCKQ